MVPLASTSRSGRTIRPSRRVKESLNKVSIESQGSVAPPLTMVTRSRGGKK
jgi:hypothetical protein